MAQLNLSGDIIPNEMKWIYDWLEWESTCPNDARSVIAEMQPGEELEIFINSGGGDVQSGQELYSLFQTVNSVAKVQSFAASAAGVAAMGCKKVLMSNVATIMIHNVSCCGVTGDYHQMDKASEMLKALNETMANAYVAKSGMELKDVLKLMDRESWLSAKGAIDYGFADGYIEPDQMTFANVDKVVFTNAVAPVQLNASLVFGLRLTDEIKQRVIQEKEKLENDAKLKDELTKDLYMFGV